MGLLEIGFLSLGDLLLTCFLKFGHVLLLFLDRTPMNLLTRMLRLRPPLPLSLNLEYLQRLRSLLLDILPDLAVLFLQIIKTVIQRLHIVFLSLLGPLVRIERRHRVVRL